MVYQTPPEEETRVVEMPDWVKHPRRRGLFRPIMTMVFMAVCILFYLVIFASENLMGFLSSANGSIASLYEGMLYKQTAVFLGEYWRLLTCGFLHAELFHILVNMFSLWILGSAVERIFGAWRFSVLYVLSIIAGSVATYALSNINSSLGASGGIFGLAGALAALYFTQKNSFGRLVSKQIFVIIGFNIMYGLMFGSLINNFAHIGGLVAGFLLAFLLGIPRENRYMVLRVFGVVVFLIVLAGGIVFGDIQLMR